MEEVIAKMEKDEDMGQLYKQSLDLITPGTSFHPSGSPTASTYRVCISDP